MTNEELEKVHFDLVKKAIDISNQMGEVGLKPERILVSDHGQTLGIYFLGGVIKENGAHDLVSRVGVHLYNKDEDEENEGDVVVYMIQQRSADFREIWSCQIKEDQKQNLLKVKSFIEGKAFEAQK